VSRKAAILALGMSMLAVSTGAWPVSAQDPASTPAPICGVLTSQEITQALGQDLPVSSSFDTSCSWDSFATGGTIGLSVSIAPGRLADLTAAYTDATATDIAGHHTLVSSDGSFLFAEVDGGILSVFAFSAGLEVPEGLSAALLGLAERVLERLPSISLPVPATPAPAPSFVGDPEMQVLFPSTVAGQPLQVQTLTGAELFGAVDPNDAESQAELQVVRDLLATQGKTLDDVSLGFGYFATTDTSGGITAVRIRGADIRALSDSLMPLLLTDVTDPQTATVQVAGREVIQITDGPDGPDVERRYAYAKDDILWLVQATEPQLSELIGQLP